MKVAALVDALGNLTRFLLLPGQAHDMKGVALRIKGISFGALLAELTTGAQRRSSHQNPTESISVTMTRTHTDGAILSRTPSQRSKNAGA